MPKPLSPREHQVLSLVARGMSTKEVAAELGISVKTAGCHRAALLAKLEAVNIADAICRAAARGLLRSVQVATDHSLQEASVAVAAAHHALQAQRDELSRLLQESRSLRTEARTLRAGLVAECRALQLQCGAMMRAPRSNRRERQRPWFSAAVPGQGATAAAASRRKHAKPIEPDVQIPWDAESDRAGAIQLLSHETTRSAFAGSGIAGGSS